MGGSRGSLRTEPLSPAGGRRWRLGNREGDLSKARCLACCPFIICPTRTAMPRPYLFQPTGSVHIPPARPFCWALAKVTRSRSVGLRTHRP